MCLSTDGKGILLLSSVAHADKSSLKKSLRELVGIAGSSWREEQGKASNGGRYFAHLAGCVVAQTENKRPLRNDGIP